MRETTENLNNQAMDLAAGGEFPEAIACLKRALSIEKENYLLWYNLGITYRNSGDFYSAKGALEQALVLNDNDEEIFESLGLVSFALQEYEEAFEYYIEGLELNSADPHLWNNLGVLHFTQGEYEKACEAFEEAVTIFPHYYDALFNLRDTYSELGNTVGAAACDEQLKKIVPPAH